MKRKYLLFLICCFLIEGAFSQTLQQARSLYSKGNYEEAKPTFKKYVTSSPSNANYNLWYGVCCLKTGEANEAIPYLEKAVKRRATGGQFYLAQAYHESYRFQEAVDNLEEYISELKKRKKETEEADSLLKRSKLFLRMIKGVEEVCIIDSFVIDKKDFLNAYKINEYSGKLFTYNDFFQKKGDHTGTVYQTEIGNKIYYGERNEKGELNIFTQNKLSDEWGKPHPLPSNINTSGNTNYPYILSDGITIYYATDGEGLGGYDIYVTRYNTETDAYLTPENVGMPFNSPFNDYMYVIDEYNNLGWFASDRFQPEEKVCVYVFIPNTSKQTYNYETMDQKQLILLAQIHSLHDTWNNKDEVNKAQQRLKEAILYKPQEQQRIDFKFIIDDNTTYYLWEEFKSPKAKLLYKHYQQLEKDYLQQKEKLRNLRDEYIQADKETKVRISPSILDLEKRTLQMSQELDTLEIDVRNAEKIKSK